MLKKEWQQIDQTHTAILKLAQEGNLEDSEDVKFYDEKSGFIKNVMPFSDKGREDDLMNKLIEKL